MNQCANVSWRDLWTCLGALLDSLVKVSNAQPKRATMVKYSIEQTQEG